MIDVEKALEKIHKIIIAAGRKPEDIKIIAVSKKQPMQMIENAFHAGIADFGENRVQEFLDKFDQFDFKINWHFVGHLQTNKVKFVVDKVKLIHSVDSVKLAQKISDLSLERNLKTPVLLQANVSGEESKYGFSADSLKDNSEQISRMKGINVRGLMTMAPYTDDIKIITAGFRNLRLLSEQLQESGPDNFDMQYLSMGMSNDYEIAIKEGSNMLRLGTVLLGPRN